MIISATLTLTTADTGYTLKERLASAGIAIPDSWRVSSLFVYRDDTDLYIVRDAGAYANTSHVPDQYGFILTSGLPKFELTTPRGNLISLDEIVVGCGTSGKKVHVFAFTT